MISVAVLWKLVCFKVQKKVKIITKMHIYSYINLNYVKHEILSMLFSTLSTAIYYIRLLKCKCSLAGSYYLRNVFSCTLLDKHINSKISESHQTFVVKALKRM